MAKIQSTVSSLQHEVSIAKLKLLELERAVSVPPTQRSTKGTNATQNAELENLLRNSNKPVETVSYTCP
jgi:hypothetical protein